MTTANDILDVLRRDPTDATALHVYADFLLQRGDPRGELALLQHRPLHELDLAGLERLMELVAQHGFLVLPDDPEADVLRFRGGTHHELDRVTIEYRLVHGGHRYEVLQLGNEGVFRITVDDFVVHEQKRSAITLLLPEVANVILSQVSDVIRTGAPWDSVQMPALVDHPRRYVGRFPTEPLPPVLAARWPHVADCEIERRDLDRWRALVRRWGELRR